MPQVEDLRSHVPKRDETRKESSIRKIIRHHSATTSGDFWSFWHQTWSQFTPAWQTGGYHEIILRDGTVQVCYAPSMVTNGVSGHNSYTYHICLVGDGSFTDVQEKSWHERVERAMKNLQLSVSDVLGHRELPGTSTLCPGIEMNEVRAALWSGEPLTGSESIILNMGDAGQQVQQLQADLMQAGENLSIYGADGQFGTETQAAVEAFQRKHGLKEDGIAGPRTMEKLEEVLSEGGDTVDDHTPNPSHQSAWKWAEEQGLLNGKYPREPVSREQLATVLHRYHQMIKGES
ncbi:peptidoglycan recognition protein family protein [Salibacterium qingdaonense]|uniref:Autolysin n=1 Tax=Salibacterium qingdaonense TaxID=266892 RepID=A0A1I4IRY5_9BACI|nr:N-acetylmuramoyl-L-alanine amidase [Salibacterium qingdaonense]SFL56611.1 Putative peptidoglycan binding domain-containing protein [Salibacterium qingdaonense]